MKKTIEINREELVAICMLCASEAMLILMEVSSEDRGKEKEIAKRIERKINSTIDISWNRDRTKQTH